MKKQFTVKQVYIDAFLWYGMMDIDSCCLAENRLNKGERPEGWKE